MIMRWDWRILNASPHDFGGQCHEAQKLVTKWRHASRQQGFHCAQVQSCRSSAALHTELRQRESKGCPTQKDCEGRTSNMLRAWSGKYGTYAWGLAIRYSNLCMSHVQGERSMCWFWHVPAILHLYSSVQTTQQYLEVLGPIRIIRCMCNIWMYFLLPDAVLSDGVIKTETLRFDVQVDWQQCVDHFNNQGLF